MCWWMPGEHSPDAYSSLWHVARGCIVASFEVGDMAVILLDYLIPSVGEWVWGWQQRGKLPCIGSCRNSWKGSGGAMVVGRTRQKMKASHMCVGSDMARSCDSISKFLSVQIPHTMAPNGSEFSHRVWISFCIFYFLVLSFRIFTGSYCIVFMYIYIILLRNTKGKSSWKIIAGMIRQWFWCKYFACTFIL